MKFIGIDLTSAFARQPRSIDVAVLDGSLAVCFCQAAWPSSALVTARNPALLREMLLQAIGCAVTDPVILAIDGPQALARPREPRRDCERILGTPGRTPYRLPAATEGMPFQAYIRSSIDLFAALLRDTPPYRLVGFDSMGHAEANLFEVFPGAEWTVLAGRRLPRKSTRSGREARYELFKQLGVVFPAGQIPSADQNDALVGAYLAWCVHHKPDNVQLVGAAPSVVDGELREGWILHATRNAQLDGALEQLPDDQPASTTKRDGPDATEREDDWNNDDALLLFLTDYGLVHGNEPENNWLIPERNYLLETQPPDKPISFQLTHASKFAGRLGWRAAPTVKEVIGQLGYPRPDDLKRDNGTTLRVKVLHCSP